MIGVNAYVEPPEPVEIPIHKIDAAVEARQIGRLKAVRASRDNALVARLLDRLAETAADPTANLMGPTIEAVKARASMGEIVARLRNLWGSYVERPVF